MGRPKRDALTGLDSLTPSERGVAELAAAGHGNREIAQVLFVMPRTVESHLTSVYRKLGISARAGCRTVSQAAPRPERPAPAPSISWGCSLGGVHDARARRLVNASRVTEDTFRIVIDARVDSEEIRGSAGNEVGEAEPFLGWLG